MPLADFSLRVFSVFEVRDLHFSYSIWNRLRGRFVLKFVLLRHILVGDTDFYFYERLKLNPFSCTFVYFTIVIFTWYDFTSYYIVLSIYISDRLFDTLIIYLGVLFTSLIISNIQIF